MRLSIRALIFSAIVFPGAGYFILNKTKQALAFLVATLGCLAVPVYDAFQKAQIISEKIIYGYIPIDMNAVRQEIENLPDMVDSDLIFGAYLIILVLWLAGMIDSYRTGKAQEKLTPE